MAEEDLPDAHSPTEHNVADMPYMPATVVDHEEHPTGMTLVTLDPDPDTNIEIYNDDRPAHRSGNPPEVAE